MNYKKLRKKILKHLIKYCKHHQNMAKFFKLNCRAHFRTFEAQSKQPHGCKTLFLDDPISVLILFRKVRCARSWLGRHSIPTWCHKKWWPENFTPLTLLQTTTNAPSITLIFLLETRSLETQPGFLSKIKKKLRTAPGWTSVDPNF